MNQENSHVIFNRRQLVNHGIYQNLFTKSNSTDLETMWRNPKNTRPYFIEFLRTEMMPDPSNYHREYLPDDSYSPIQLEGSDVTSIPKNWTEYSFVILNCLMSHSAYNFTNCVKGQF